MSWRVKSPQQREAEARELRNWPGLWQTDPILRHLRAHIPAECEMAWQSIFSEIGSETVLRELRGLGAAPDEIATLPIYADEIHSLLDGYLRQSDSTASKDALPALLAKVPPFEFIAAACAWCRMLPGLDSAPMPVPRWGVPVAGRIALGDTQAHFCSNAFEVYRAVRAAGMLDALARARTVHTLVEACLWYQQQCLELVFADGTRSLLCLSLAPGSQAYAYTVDNHNLQASDGQEQKWLDPGCEHGQAAAALLVQLNQQENQPRLAELYQQCETRRTPADPPPANAYLWPLIETLPELLRGLVDVAEFDSEQGRRMDFEIRQTWFGFDLFQESSSESK